MALIWRPSSLLLAALFSIFIVSRIRRERPRRNSRQPMFCPNCGKAEQPPGGYCRSCGEFLANVSDRFYLVSKILGIDTPQKHLKLNLAVDLLTFGVCSSLLLIFLMGYFDGRYTRTGESAPPIIYPVYVFLGLISAWQFVSIINSVILRSDLSRAKNGRIKMNTPDMETVLPAAEAQGFLPPATSEHIAPTSVTDHTTKILDKLSRK